VLGKGQSIAQIHEDCAVLIYLFQQIVRSLQHHIVDHITSTIQHAYVISPEDVVLPSSELVTIIVSSKFNLLPTALD
jgi:hypothetical protein